MALQPALKKFQLVGSPAAAHTLEVYLDYVCPFSAKIFLNALDPIIKPAVSPGGELDGKLNLIIRLQVQPWHGSSTFTHESAIAVGRVAPEAFWDYSKVLFKRQEEFFDRSVADKTPVQIRKELVDLINDVPSIDNSKHSEIIDLLTYKTSPNGGVAVTEDLKTNVKISRQNGIHVSPTAVFDGIIASAVSSSWGSKEWSEFFASNIKV